MTENTAKDLETAVYHKMSALVDDIYRMAAQYRQENAALRLLVTDWQALVQEHAELPTYGDTALAEFEDWEECREQLQARTKKLLGEEVKP